MTQEELDALMAEGMDEILNDDQSDQDVVKNEEPKAAKEEVVEKKDNDNYRLNATEAWPPPPPTNDHKMVLQLDDVTKDSEQKATELFDKLDCISEFLSSTEENTNNLKDGFEYNIEVFKKLHAKFPNVEIFSEAIEKNSSLNDSLGEVVDNIQMAQDEVMMTMDMMQYQDIHRQKIERVINVMRALSKYMNSLFEGKIEDEKRVGSAVHIEGDSTTEDVVSNEDIEALIESLGKK